jgi:antitoxin component of RelBE/YafQ-DinJ toxin-antitoxin module
MDTKTIQTRNILATVLEKAEYRAVSDGLSSVQDAIRMFLTAYSKGEIKVGFNYEISRDKEAEYLNDSKKMEKLLSSKKIKAFNNTSDLLNALKNE